jgi:hypothetical protein
MWFLVAKLPQDKWLSKAVYSVLPKSLQKEFFIFIAAIDVL